uniref:Uncharacterized protein n=1 Tax=Setaria italica TaxID=4555 RepID=K3YKJ2_SETIT
MAISRSRGSARRWRRGRCGSNSAALFLGTLLLGAGSVALHPRAPPIVVVDDDHLTRVTETIAITAFAHDLCIILQGLEGLTSH